MAKNKDLTEGFFENIDFEKSELNESLKKNVKFKFGSKELDLGCPEHIKILKALHRGMEALKNCYNLGSANRLIFSSACHKLKKLIEKYSK